MDQAPAVCGQVGGLSSRAITACRSSSVSVHQRDGGVLSLSGAVSRVGCLEETCSLGEQTQMSEDQQGKVNLHCICSQTLFLLGD